ncbi:7669_t:CDS:2, partial [Paraglomus brasilianum]
LNNLMIYPMYHKTFSDKFGFTEDDICIVLHYHGQDDKKNAVKEWYNGYHAADHRLYNPWSILTFLDTKQLGRHWVDTAGGTATIMELIWHSGTDFKIKTTQLINREAVKVEISRKLDYSALRICTDSA